MLQKLRGHWDATGMTIYPQDWRSLVVSHALPSVPPLQRLRPVPTLSQRRFNPAAPSCSGTPSLCFLFPRSESSCSDRTSAYPALPSAPDSTNPSTFAAATPSVDSTSSMLAGPLVGTGVTSMAHLVGSSLFLNVGRCSCVGVCILSYTSRISATMIIRQARCVIWCWPSLFRSGLLFRDS